MKVSGRHLNKKEDGHYRSLYYRKRVYQRPVVARKSYTGLIVVVIGLAILILVVLVLSS